MMLLYHALGRPTPRHFLRGPEGDILDRTDGMLVQGLQEGGPRVMGRAVQGGERRREEGQGLLGALPALVIGLDLFAKHGCRRGLRGAAAAMFLQYGGDDLTEDLMTGEPRLEPFKL